MQRKGIEFIVFFLSGLLRGLRTAWKRTCRWPEIPLCGPVSGSFVFHQTPHVRRVSGTVFFPMRTFSVARGKCGLRYLTETWRVKAWKLCYSSWFATNNGIPQASTTDQVEYFYSHRVLLFLGFARGSTALQVFVTGVRYQNSTVRELSISDISRYVKCHSRFPDRIFHGTWGIIWDSPVGYFTKRKVVEWSVKCEKAIDNNVQ